MSMKAKALFLPLSGGRLLEAGQEVAFKAIASPEPWGSCEPAFQPNFHALLGGSSLLLPPQLCLGPDVSSTRCFFNQTFLHSVFLYLSYSRAKGQGLLPGCKETL